jgi:hypothetical protein
MSGFSSAKGSREDGAGGKGGAVPASGSLNQRYAPTAYYSSATFESYNPFVSKGTESKSIALPTQMHFHDALFYDATETVEGALAGSDVPFVEITKRTRFVAVTVWMALLCAMVRPSPLFRRPAQL